MKKKVFLGAVAGMLGGVAMKAVVRFIDRDSFGLSARTDANTAHELWQRMEWTPLSDKRAQHIGSALHYGFAVGAGAVYVVSATKFPVLRAGRGAAFGTALWLVGDELAVSASGLEDPFQCPIPSHASALAAHILYGMIVDAIGGMIPEDTLYLNAKQDRRAH